MDGVVAYLLSRKFTKDTVIGMGAIKGAACQVQSINKVGKTTTITLKWEDNVGGVHTQAFDVEDGLDGISVSNATIKPNGHLELTLSDGNTIDCGKVLPQYDAMPNPSSSNEGQILQYIGTTTSNYTNGYFYECINDGGTYKWVEKLVQDSYTKIQIGDLSDLPDNTKNVVQNIIDINDKVNDKENIFRYTILPTPSNDNVGDIVEFIGATTANYINGYFYQCKFDGSNYSWVQKNIQPGGGGTGSDNVVEGYFNETDNLFYEEITYINPIVGAENVIYISLDTNLLYRYDINNSIFIRVDEHADGQTIQVMSMPTASSDELGNIYQFVGTTTVDYTNGYFYKCVENSGVYSWENINIQDSYNKTEIGNLTNLPDNTKDVVENISDLNTNKENIFRYAHGTDIPTASATNVDTIIQYIGTTTADYNSGFFYQSQFDTETSTYKWVNIEVQPASGTSAVDSVNGKVGVVVLDAEDIGLQSSEMPNADIDHLNQIVQFIGSTTSTYTNGYWYKCVYDSDNDTYLWIQVNVQPHITVDSALSDTSENPVQNKVIYSALDDKVDKVTGKDLSENDYTDVDKAIVDSVTTNLSNKADKVSSATNGDLAGLNSSGNLTDSGILASNVVVKSSTAGLIKNDGTIDTNTYLTATDVADKADKVESAVNGDLAGLDSNGNLTDSGLLATNIISKSSTVGLVKNDGTIDTNSYATTAQLANKTDKVENATDGNLAGLDSNGNLTDSGVTASDVVTKVSSAVSGNLASLNSSGGIVDSGVVATHVVTISSTAGLIKNDGTIDTNTYATTTALGDKADKVTSATANDFAALDSNGNLVDSGINKNIVPSGATSSNKLATANDIPTELNDLSVDVEITSPVNAQVLTYNSTSGKWENQTGSAPVGGATFQGSILFANLPTTGMVNGDWYDIKDAFTTDNRFEEGSGIACAAGTDVIWVNADSKWNILTPSGVYSFNGRSGAVVPASGDYTASDVGLGNVVNTGDSDTPTNGGTTKFTTGGAYTELNKKVDKLTTGFTSGHLASLDSNGAIADSGKSASDFSEDAWWTSTATVNSSNQVTFSGLNNSYAYELFCEDTLAYITNLTKTTQSGTITLVYTLSGATQGTVCKLRIVK